MQITAKPLKFTFKNESFFIFLGDEHQPVTKMIRDENVVCEVRSHDNDSPPYFSIYVTDQCNMSCDYCFNKIGDIRQSNTIPRYNVDELASFFEELNVKEIYVRFFGGEPLLHFDWIKLCVERLKKTSIQFNFNIFTNGLLLSDEIIGFLVNNNFQIFVSLGLPDEMEKGIKYGKKVHENVKTLMESTRDVIGSAVWMPSSSISIIELLKYHFDTGIKYITFLFEWGGNFDSTSQTRVLIELEKFADFYVERILAHDLKYLQIHPFIDYIRHILFDRPFYFDACAAGKTFAAIATDGSLYPCHCFTTHSGYNCGSVKEHTWNKLFQEYNVLNIDPCKNCEIWYLCKAYCYADNLITNNCLFQGNTSKCFIEKNLIACCGYIVLKLMEHPVEFETYKKILSMKGIDNVTH